MIPPARHKVTDLPSEQLKSKCNMFCSVLKEFSIEQDKLYERACQEMMKQEAVGKKVTKVKKDKMTQMTIFVLALTGAEILKQIYLVAVTAGFSSSVMECGFLACNRFRYMSQEENDTI